MQTSNYKKKKKVWETQNGMGAPERSTEHVSSEKVGGGESCLWLNMGPIRMSISLTRLKGSCAGSERALSPH